MTPIASLDRVCGCRQPRGIEHRQRFFPRRREDLFSRVPHPREALPPLTQLVARVERRLRPTAPVNQGVHVRHELTPLAPLRPPAGHVQEPLAFARFPMPFDPPEARVEHSTDVLLERLAFAGAAAVS